MSIGATKYKLDPTVLRELFDYRDGALWWRAKASRRFAAGMKAGTVRKTGYVVVVIRRKFYLMHRVIFAWHYGVWPTHEIDHIDGDPRNSRIENLRDATPATNQQNLKTAQKNNRAGFLGVSRTNPGSGGYAARIQIGMDCVRLGTYPTPEEAHAVYVEAKRRLHAGCTI